MRTAVVAGGASGIGRAVVLSLVAEGWSVRILDRDESALQEVVAAIRAEAPDVCAGHVVDITEADAVAAVARDLAADGPLQALVNSAGVLQLGTIADVTPADWDRVVGVNLKGTYCTCRAFMPALEHSRGAIVNLASVSGRTRSMFSAPNYVASKAGVIGLTMVLAAQHAAAGVRVNCVAPGVVDTPMLGPYTPEQRAAMRGAIPLGRLADASEIADVIAYLLSDKASYVTGQTIDVNGGQFMH